MKKRLVNHGGIVQWKIIINTCEGLEEYAELSSKQFAKHFSDLITSPKEDLHEIALKNKHHANIICIAQSEEVSIIEATDIASKRKIMGMFKAIQRGETLVVNKAGGYTCWNDNEMFFVEETEQNIRIAAFGYKEFDPHVLIVESPVLILENQTVSKKVLDYVKTELKQTKYSVASNLVFAESGATADYIKQALKKGCNTIVAETTLSNTDQLEELAHLFEKLPPMSFHLFTYGDLVKELENILGAEETKNILSKHKVEILK